MKNIKVIIASLLTISPGVLLAEKPVIDESNNLELIRFELDNDFIIDDDSQFSNGWSLQYHTKLYNNWDEADAYDWVKWVGNNVYGLAADDKLVRMGHGIGQNMVTPGDLTVKESLPGDIPYAGTLTYSFNWQSFNAKEMSVLQMNIGIMGKASFAEEFQKFVHNDLGRGDNPEGWGSQRDDEPIINIAYQRAWRLAHFGEYDSDWSVQFTVAPSLHLGNLYTGADLALACRFGWNIQEGFSAYPSIPGRGFYQSSFLPKSKEASRHGFEFILAAKGQAFGYSVIYDGSILTNDDRDVEREDFVLGGIFGLNYHYYDKYSLRFYFIAASDLIDEDKLPVPEDPDDKTDGANSFGTFVFEYHF